MPPYFPQAHKYACSLATLRSVLAVQGVAVSEEKLVAKVQQDYGKNFKNLWNPTIAKLACEYGIDTKMYALWPLFKLENLAATIEKIERNPAHMDVRKYENPDDKDTLGEPLPLAYKEVFKAIKNGCKVTYGGLTEGRIIRILGRGHYIQTSIKINLLYPDDRASFHSILLYKCKEGIVTYHDPARYAAMECEVEKLLRAANGAGAFMEYTL